MRTLCVSCSYCEDQCPMNVLFGSRRYTPRGICLIAEEVGSEEEIDPLPLYLCLLCGRCEAVCPFKGGVLSTVVDARRMLVEKGEIPSEIREMSTDLSSSRPEIKGVRGSSVILIEDYFLRRKIPREAMLLRRALRKLKLPFQIAKLDNCCGMLLLSLGFTREAESTLNSVIDVLKESGAREAIVTCPLCFDALSGEMSVKPHLSYLLELLETNLPYLHGPEMSVVYVKSCVRPFDEIAYRIFDIIPGVEMSAEMSGFGGCCVTPINERVAVKQLLSDVERLSTQGSLVFVSALPYDRYLLSKLPLKFPLVVGSITELVLLSIGAM